MDYKLKGNVDNMWKKLIVSDLSGKIITIFKDIFLGIYFLKITQWNIFNVSIYFIALYIAYPIILYMINHIFTKINLVKIFRMGLFVNLLKCIILLLTGDKIVNYIIMFGIIDAIGDALYYYAQQILIKRINKDGKFEKYFTANYIIKSTFGIIMPVIFGYCITSNSYMLAFGVLSIFTLFSLLMSFTLKIDCLEHQKINIKKFKESIKINNQSKMMNLIACKTFVRGLSSYGVLSTLITILTYMIVENEFSLGNISSFITVISMVIIYILGKYVNKKKLSKSFVPLAVLQSFIIIILSFSMIFGDINANFFNSTVTLGFVLILIYNIVNGICNPIFEYANNIIYYECMVKQKIEKEYEITYNFIFETILNISRATGYMILILIAMTNFNLNVIACMIVGFTLMYIVFSYLLKEIEQRYLKD